MSAQALFTLAPQPTRSLREHLPALGQLPNRYTVDAELRKMAIHNASILRCVRGGLRVAKKHLRCAYLAWLVGLENGEISERAREPSVCQGRVKRVPTRVEARNHHVQVGRPMWSDQPVGAESR